MQSESVAPDPDTPLWMATTADMLAELERRGAPTAIVTMSSIGSLGPTDHDDEGHKVYADAFVGIDPAVTARFLTLAATRMVYRLTERAQQSGDLPAWRLAHQTMRHLLDALHELTFLTGTKG
jgi:hypothetical protein